MDKEVELKRELNAIIHYCECAKNKLEHIRYGELSAKQMLNTYINSIESSSKKSVEFLREILFSK